MPEGIFPPSQLQDKSTTYLSEGMHIHTLQSTLDEDFQQLHLEPWPKSQPQWGYSWAVFMQRFLALLY